MASVKPVIVVTGATGFVGLYVVKRLLKERVRIRCLVRDSSNLNSLTALGNDVSFCFGDINNIDSLREAFDGAWGVINLAGYREFWSHNRDDFYKINEEGAGNVFQACLDTNVSKVVQVSTPLAFGVPDVIPFNEDSVSGVHPSDYARSKYLGDKIGWDLYEKSHLPLSIVYLAAVIGSGDKKSTMEVKRAVNKKMPALVGADTTYTYVYIGDAAESIVRVLLKDDTVGKRYLIGTERASTREYFNKIGKIANVPIPNINIPEKLLLPLAKYMEWVSRFTGKRPVLPLDVLKTTAAGSLIFDGTRAVKELGMVYTSLDVALAESIRDIRKVY